MNKQNHIIVESLQRIINKFLFIKKKSLFKYNDVEFYPSEVHLMLMIKDRTSTNATKIADMMGITKGAVSQTLTRLEKKGVLVKTKDPQYKNELTLTLTALGSEAFSFYKSKAAEIEELHNVYLNEFDEKEKMAIVKFLAGVEKIYEKLE